MENFSGQTQAWKQAIRRKNSFCGNQQTSYAPVSLQKLLSHLGTYRFT